MKEADTDWLEELELNPGVSAVAMGTRALGERPWLITDAAGEAELALKAELCATRHDEVFAALPGTEPAAESVITLLRAEGLDVRDDLNLHPLDRAGRSVQEDLCLLRRREAGWHLEAASLCFPSRWRLSMKIDRHVTEVHGPVKHYENRLARRVDSMFDRLSSKPVWRRNWFVHPEPALFQPERPDHEDLVPAASALRGLYVRSERQTLRAVQPGEWVLFTIRVQRASVAVLVGDPSRRERFATYLRSAPEAEVAHRGMPVAQADQLRAALDAL